MALTPEIGRRGGQQYPVLRSIQKFLQQMAEGGARAAPTVIKELLQNADDAAATEVAVILDERQAPDELRAQGAPYADLFAPALLVRNTAPFHVCDQCRRDNRDCDHDKRDDFHAIRDVAAGHKRAQATAAGRFGIGFNSVYFLTDTPLLFSRREVHVFDLLHRVFDDNGWQFTLNDFPADASSRAGVLKWVLEWCFPKVALADRSFGVLAGDPRGDYRQAVFRLPLRTSAAGTPAIYDDRFPSLDDRRRVLKEMADESARSILFLKHITAITFSILRERELEEFARIEATPPPADFADFLRTLREADQGQAAGPRECEFPREVTYQQYADPGGSTTTRSFHVKHALRFDDPDLRDLRDRLRRNDERAIPWVAVGVPLDLSACRIDGDGPAAWRVFLPLLEEGPSSCVFNASLFIGPSRQRIEYRLHESDEGRRRTDWNRALVEKALVPLLQDLSLELPDLARSLLETHPQEYLALFPRLPGDREKGTDGGLTAFVRQLFARGTWYLRLPDLWGNCFDIFIGDQNHLSIEMVAEWLGEYRDRFRVLSSPERRFVRFALGDALAARIGKTDHVGVVRHPSTDVALSVLCHPEPPRARDLTKLVQAAARAAAPPQSWENAWGLVAPDGSLLRYSRDVLYVVDDPRQHAAVAALRRLRLRLPLLGVAWVRPDEGLTASDVQPRPDNIFAPTATAALELLRRFPEDNAHDQLTQAQAIRPVVDFLITEPITRIPLDARLGFLIRTAHNKESRRGRGVILLRPATATAADTALWEVWFRRIFAEVDPDFAREVNRLLTVHPGTLDMLHAPDCHVAVGAMRDALRILHTVRTHAPEVYELLAVEMNNGERRDARQIVASGLLDFADAQWDRLDADERYTVLALPIHRRPDGSFASLVSARGGDPSSVGTAFRLQSDDDIEDAPVTLPACQLVQTANAAARRFYRQRVGLEPHGRVAVLKDVLRQIGEGPTPANEAMLRYLARYYEDTVQRLAASGDDAADARTLQELLSSARTVPCVDGVWRPSRQCFSGRRLAERLLQQGWPRNRLGSLIEQLCHGQRVATVDDAMLCFIERLHRLPELDPSRVAEWAITSESETLPFSDRVKLLNDNWRDRPRGTVSPSSAVGRVEVQVVRGRARLAECELLDERNPLLSPIVLQRLAPSAIDVDACAGEWNLPAERCRAILEAFGVPPCSAEALDARLCERLPELWSELGDRERLAVVRHVGERGLAAKLGQAAASLDVVLVGTRQPRWTPPKGVVTPRWMDTRPPHLPPESQPVLKEIPDGVRAVWDHWCGARSFADVFSLVLTGVGRLQGDQSSAATAVYQWLDELLSGPLPEDFRADLRNRQWVLALQGEALELRRPSEVILHPAERVLAGRFWVPAVALPSFVVKLRDELGFQAAPVATQESLQLLAECLAERAISGGSIDSAVEAYGLVEHLIRESDVLADEWRRLAERLQVYRTFRPHDRQRTARQIFVGDAGHDVDLSSALVCLRSHSGLPKGLLARYRALAVPPVPTLEQVIEALATFGSDEPEASAAYGRLVNALDELTKGSDATLGVGHASLESFRVLSCAGTYQPISQCYWDEDFGHRKHVVVSHGRRLIDTTDRSTQRLVAWIRSRAPSALTKLRAAGILELIEPPEAVDPTPELSYLLFPWRQWLQDVRREGSVLAERLALVGLVPARDRPLEVVPVRKIQVRFRLVDDAVIEQAAAWDGPVALATGDGRILVRPPAPRSATRTDTRSSIDDLDAAIAREVAILIGGNEIVDRLESCTAEILATLERPSTVLRDLRRTYRQHFLHQYHDQVADPRFAELFDEYRRTVPSSKRAAELEERMHGLLAEGFVRARRDQIRGYGYDEFSVFAELLQNAEDAYIQRARLGMDMPSACTILYRYAETDGGGRVLDVEHRGRPFNYWQHGSRQDRSLSRDVEGVLRSAGSFKPHLVEGGVDKAPTIGRFGLGFKSVYLLTDRPEIHSGAWHFAIEAGCLPQELPSAEDLDEQVTRFRLPLRSDVDLVCDPTRLLEQLRDLLPFLGMVTRLELRHDGASPAALVVNEVEVTNDHGASGANVLVERVTIAPTDAPDHDAVQFLRCRNRDHAAQLAMLFGRDGTPARWDEAFDHDLFAILPLKAELGCGIGVSHRFEVQSGRTHLVDPRANAERFREVAGLLDGLVKALPECASAKVPLSVVLLRFWAMWRWDRGDGECKALREEMARALVALATRTPIVPTLDPTTPTSLAMGRHFYCAELPELFRDAIVAAGVTIPVPGEASPVALSACNVVADGFAGAYRRACECAAVSTGRTLARVGWDEVAHAFRERAWFADRPDLLSALAESLSEDQATRAATWLSLCQVLGETGTGQPVRAVPSDLLSPEWPGLEHVPKRLICRVSSTYGRAALALLERAGLRAAPSEEEARNWVLACDLTSSEAVGILRYLGEDDRFRTFWGLRELFLSAWFPIPGRRLSTRDAVEAGLVPEDVVANQMFRAWLGLLDVHEPETHPKPSTTPLDPREVLEGLFAWWETNGPAWIADYHARLYPAGQPPPLRASFSPRDSTDRRNWLTMLLLGTLHKLGRAQPEQNRDFLRRCERKGWLDVFADPDHDARRWMQMLEDYLDDPGGQHDYYQWMKQFVEIFQVSRWLSEYVEAILSVNRLKKEFALDQIVAPRTSAFFSGGGPDAPSLVRALGVGACFVMRELVRHRHLQQPHAHRYCYVPSKGVRDLLTTLGCQGLDAASRADQSVAIHSFLEQHLGIKRATFALGFDLPLQALAWEGALQEQLLRRTLLLEPAPGGHRVDEGWRTMPDGRRINIYG